MNIKEPWDELPKRLVVPYIAINTLSVIGIFSFTAYLTYTMFFTIGFFAPFWYYVLIIDMNNHFKHQREFEEGKIIPLVIKEVKETPEIISKYHTLNKNHILMVLPWLSCIF